MPLQDLVEEVDRVRYSQGQYLGAEDFRTEQDYHRRSLARHQIGAHTWGIVAGFELREMADPDDPRFVDPILSPGMAVDGFGRQIVSFTSVTIDSAKFDAFTDDAHRSIWLEYVETLSHPAGVGFSDCHDGEPTRTVEGFTIVVDPPTTTTDVFVDGVIAAVPPAPPGTPEIPADRSVPYQEMPAEPPVGRWLIRLGTLRWDGSEGRFRPAAAARLAEKRVYAGSIAAALLSPTDTLRVAPRAAFTDADAQPFATFEGQLRAKGRINAEREIWLEGYPARFTYAGGNEEATVISLGRDHGSGAEQRLRLRLGDDEKASTTYLSIGTKAGAGETTVATVSADGRLGIPTGVLDFGTATRQEIDLNGPANGIGTQPAMVYFRSSSEFAWYRGGKHSNTVYDPGAGGDLQLVLDGDGALDFGSRPRQMIHLWSTSTAHPYGIGVQTATLYFRTDNDVCWFRRGAHLDLRGHAGPGGTLLMKLDENASLEVRGSLSTYGAVTVGSSGADADLTVSGSIKATNATKESVQSVLKVLTYDMVVENDGDAPGSWTKSLSGEFDQVLAAFASLSGFSITGDVGNDNPERYPDTDMIPQTVWVQVDPPSTSSVSGQALCAQSNGSEDNNQTAFTLVVIGRKWT